MRYVLMILPFYCGCSFILDATPGGVADAGDVDALELDEEGGDEWEERGDGPREIPVGFVPIPAGSFVMGSPPGEPGRSNDEVQHEVTLTIPFAMMAHEMTQGEFQALMGYNPSSFTACGPTCPVERVNWHEALAAANAMSRRDGLPECFDCTGIAPDFSCDLKARYSRPQDCGGYRLPTEAEWEYAARAGTTTAFYNGPITVPDSCDPLDEGLDRIGWYCRNAEGTTHPVGLKEPNAWGLFDMSGNVWEWVWDGYGLSKDDNKTVRGGSVNWNGSSCRSAMRGHVAMSLRYVDLGLRPVKSSSQNPSSQE